MSNINWAKPIILKVPDLQGGQAVLRGAYGKDDWSTPAEFVVRLDHVVLEDGEKEYESVARFDHDGHSVFIWNPPDDGFHIDVYPSGTEDKHWLRTPPPHSDLHDVFDYCRNHLYAQSNAEYLFEVYRGAATFDPRRIGLRPA